MTTSSLSLPDRSSFLRRALYGNVIFTTVSAVACLVAAGPLSGLLGLPSPWIVASLGLALLAYAALVLRIARRQPLSRVEAWAPILADDGWVVGSALLLLNGWLPLTPAGQWLVAVMAFIVGGFALAQFVGLRRMS